MSDLSPPKTDPPTRWLSSVISSPLPLVLIFCAILGGVVALLITPREEEPQIIVPLADVLVEAPGLNARQVARQIATPLEKLLSQIDGVEHVYSMSQPDRCVVTVRFFVGEDREDSLVKIYNKLYSHTDRIPASAASWVVKPVEIDDVPILVAVLWSERPEVTDDFQLRRLAEEIEHGLQAIENTGRVEIVGGRPRQIRVELDTEALAAYQTAPLEVAWAIDVSNQLLPAGELHHRQQKVVVNAGDFIQNTDQLRYLPINVVDGVPVYLDDVARVIDGPAEAVTYTWFGWGPADRRQKTHGDAYPAVAIAISKKKGANAVWVANDAVAYLDAMQQEVFPAEVHYQVTRNLGRTADQKINNLVSSLLVAVLTVVVFIGVFLGWRSALVVGLAVPICYGITLVLDLAAGYTINRVTLFALILSLGLLVDDPITGVDNIQRYFASDQLSRRQGVLAAMAEIRGALIMSTLAIIIAFAPLRFITGMMGPYMAPMAFNVPVSVTVSTLVAFIVTPWLAMKLLRPARAGESEPSGRSTAERLYAAVLLPLIRSNGRSVLFLGIVAALFIVSMVLPVLRLVPLKLLPYDNKDEFQIVIDMPEGTTLETTQGTAAQLGAYLRQVPEVLNYTAFVGAPSPMDFNGMVRHYYLRQGPHLADIRVTLADRGKRVQQSHAILLRLRKDLEKIAAERGAAIKLVEVPPGPPVISTVAVEIYGRAATPYRTLEKAAGILADRLDREPLVVDVDTSVAAEQPEAVFIADKEKAALSGVATTDIAQTIQLASRGLTVGYLPSSREVHPLPVFLRLPATDRNGFEVLETIRVKGRAGIAKIREKSSLRDAPRPVVPLAELGKFSHGIRDSVIHHKNLQPVVYVFAEVAGRVPAEIVADVIADFNRDMTTAGETPPARRHYLAAGSGIPWKLPEGATPVWSGEGEWQITLRVFRDLGIAFGVALIGIFIILRIQTGLSAITAIIMLAIPLTVIGIMPGFWLLNQLGNRSVDGFPDPVLFTATAMIGMIALAGIVVRNSLILVEFVHMALMTGESLQAALVAAGAVRLRPILLTAGTTLLGNLVITLDPIFSGLAWAIIFGIAAATVFTLLVIPVIYHLVYGAKPGHGLAEKRSNEG
jgi:multidrug efflux pump subunit AcrB